MRALPKDFSADKNTYSIGDQYMFGNALLIKPVTEYMYNTPPQISHLIPPVVFKTNDGKNGIHTIRFLYYKNININ
jgi:alpha-D-xyloside xylohydrolase